MPSSIGPGRDICIYWNHFSHISSSPPVLLQLTTVAHICHGILQFISLYFLSVSVSVSGQTANQSKQRKIYRYWHPCIITLSNWAGPRSLQDQFIFHQEGGQECKWGNNKVTLSVLPVMIKIPANSLFYKFHFQLVLPFFLPSVFDSIKKGEAGCQVRLFWIFAILLLFLSCHTVQY